jgi:hypothetical protein
MMVMKERVMKKNSILIEYLLRYLVVIISFGASSVYSHAYPGNVGRVHKKTAPFFTKEFYASNSTNSTIKKESTAHNKTQVR